MSKTELFDYQSSIHLTTPRMIQALNRHREDAQRLASMIRLGLTHGLIERLSDNDPRIWAEQEPAS